MTTQPAPRIGAVELSRRLGQTYAPTAEQVAVIEAPLRSTLVVAGAGSGKTETMTARIVWLVANDLVRPEEVLGLTFTRKAAGELADRVTARLDVLQLGEDTARALGARVLLTRHTNSRRRWGPVCGSGRSRGSAWCATTRTTRRLRCRSGWPRTPPRPPTRRRQRS